MTAARFALAVLAGAIVCCAFIVVQFASRYWGAVGVFTADDWMALAPDVRGGLIDYALGLGFGIGLWAVLRAERGGGLLVAMGIGAIAMVVAPQINAVIYVLGLGVPIDWGLMLQGAVRRAGLPLAAGAAAGAVMWRIAYGGAARLAGAKNSRGMS
ncbi:MAG: hypothetical protein KF779_02875 [Hyphomonadaceae bacterium]|nr:hypothetical protein [Hyphomonadaceae bacterium]